jgi:putative transposon-encoded protein
LSFVNKVISWLIKNLVRIRIENATIAVPVDQQYRRKENLVTLYSGTVTTSGNSADISVDNYSAAELILKVTAVSGTTPTLDIYIEGKFENTGDYKTLASQTGITTTGVWFFTISQLVFRYIRIRWVVGGTSPSFTFTVAGQAMV